MKNPVLQLQSAPLPPEAVAVLNKGPKFVLSHKTIPYMEIIQETEKAAQNFERQNLPEKGETPRQDVSAMLHTARNNPHRHKNNLTETEQKGLKILQNKIKKKELSVNAYDKGQGFVTLELESLKSKAKAAFQNVTSDTEDRTKTVEGRIQRKLLKSKNEKKDPRERLQTDITLWMQRPLILPPQRLTNPTRTTPHATSSPIAAALKKALHHTSFLSFNLSSKNPNIAAKIQWTSSKK